MDGIRNQYNTPSRKMSLRRKRSIKTEGNGESPVHKKTSPASTRNGVKNYCFTSVKNERVVDGGSCNEGNVSQVYHTRRSSALQNSAATPGLSTPKNLKAGRSTEKKNDAKRSSKLQEQRMRQHSPDTPFMSSQLCGTQECEVVWDCNSPGFSKDDLKRMSRKAESDESPSPVVPVFVAPVLHRALFPRTRSRLASTASAVNSTAQLDELLSQLTAKGSLSSTSSNGLSTASCSKTQALSDSTLLTEDLLLPHFPPADKDSQPASPPNPPDLAVNFSSQPFKVAAEGQNGTGGPGGAATNDPAELEMLDETAWGDDLNTAICDLSDGGEVHDSQSELPSNKVNGASVVKAEKKDKSNDSLDIFDDDYFNDTLIESTQVWEKEILEKVAENATVPAATSKPSDVDPKLQKEINSSKLNSIICHPPSDKVQLIESVRQDSSSGDSYVKNSNLLPSAKASEVKNKTEASIGCSPVIGKSRVSHAKVENTPQRRVRNSFRLDGHLESNPTSQKWNMPNIDTYRNNRANTSHVGAASKSIPENAVNKSSSKFETSRCSSAMTKQNSAPLPKNCSLEPEMPRSQPRKALFVGGGGGIKSLERIDGRVENSRNSSFPRSQSTGNVIATSSKPSTNMSRPCKSEDAEGSREFEEDDVFFESLLCTLPEDEMILGALKSSEVSVLQEKKTFSSMKTAASSSLVGASTLSNVNRSKSACAKNNAVHSSGLVGEFTDNNINNKSLGSHFNQGRSVSSPDKHKAAASVSSEKSFTAGISSKNTAGISSKNTAGISSKNTAGISKSNQDSNLLAGSSVSVKREVQKSPPGDILDDDLFEDDVLSLIDEVESQFGSQPLPSVETSSQPTQFSQSQPTKCTSDEIARKREEAQRRREEKLKREELARKKEEPHWTREEKPKACGSVRQEGESQLEREKKHKAEEIARKREEALRRKEEKLRTEETARKKEEARLKEEKQRADEIARKREEALRRKEEKLRADEIARKHEEAQRLKRDKQLKEEIARQREEVHRLKEEKELMEDIARQREEVQRLKEKKEPMEEIAPKREEVQRLKKEKERAEEIARKRVEVQGLKEEKDRAEEIARKRDEAQRRREEKQKMDEIARKKEEALRRREEKQRSRQQQHPPPPPPLY